MSNFIIATLNKWRRHGEKPYHVNTQPRPHIVPITDDGKGYLEYMLKSPAREGPVGIFATGYGHAEYNGDWIRVYRFIEVKNEANTLQAFEDSLERWVRAGKPAEGPIGDVSEQGRELKRIYND